MQGTERGNGQAEYLCWQESSSELLQLLLFVVIVVVVVVVCLYCWSYYAVSLVCTGGGWTEGRGPLR